MAGIGAILAGLLALLFFLIVLVMITPLWIELTVRKEVEITYSAVLRPLGRLGPLIRISGRRKDPTAAKSAISAAHSRRHLSGARRYQVIRAAVPLAVGILRRVRIRALILDAKFGSGDPATTGQLLGLFAPLVYGTHPAQRLRISLEPVFERATLSGHAELNISLIPAALIAPAARFGWDAFGPVR